MDIIHLDSIVSMSPLGTSMLLLNRYLIDSGKQGATHPSLALQKGD